MKNANESSIVTAICDYLALKHYFFWRNNNVPIYDAKNQSFRAMPKYAKRGLPDIVLLVEGKMIGLEVKTEKGRQSDHQKEFESDFVKNKGYYVVVRSVEETVEFLKRVL